MRRFIDLFSGIGGFRVALEQEGMNCVFSSEIDKHACNSYKQNFGESPFGDITKISNNDIPEHDILCAGFPCQPFSLSGLMKGLQDERGRLFYEVIRIARHRKPPLLLLENVKNILTIDNGRVINEIHDRLKRIGYTTEQHVLNASHFGIPQKRERVYFVCIRDGSPLSYSAPKPTYEKKYLSDILLPNEQCANLIVGRDDIDIRNDLPTDSELQPLRVGSLNKGGQGERIYSAKGHAITLSANGGGVGARTGLYLVDDKVRRLHINEAKQVMGFDVTHHVSDGMQGYKQLGNAVVPAMIRKVYDGIRA